MKENKYKIIDRFHKYYAFLSNLYPVELEIEGVVFPSVENAFQAAKTKDISAILLIANSSPRDVKKIGRKLDLREDWEEVKIPIMRTLLRHKFKNEDLKQKLLKTGNSILIEGNYWKDTFWGICENVGYNMLGLLLMEIRAELQIQETFKKLIPNYEQ